MAKGLETVRLGGTGRDPLLVLVFHSLVSGKAWSVTAMGHVLFEDGIASPNIEEESAHGVCVMNRNVRSLPVLFHHSTWLFLCVETSVFQTSIPGISELVMEVLGSCGVSVSTASEGVVPIGIDIACTSQSIAGDALATYVALRTGNSFPSRASRKRWSYDWL